jgi:23S rRNA-/tRNA-specific pseudouridylate synthase
MKCICHKKSIVVLSDVRACVRSGKTSVTLVRNIFYDAENDVSLVLAVPVTGRTHQIRVHLQVMLCVYIYVC